MVYAFGLGYGLSMMANAGMAVAVAKYRYKAPISPFGMACTGLYALYGARLSTYIARRNEEPSYIPRLENLQMKTDMMGLLPKTGIVAGVSFAQALYALPLAVATSPAVKQARPAVRAAGWFGVALAAVGLVLETLADEQKLAAKRQDPKGPVMDGLYSYCKHPNYFGEVLFHCGISCMGLSGTPMQVIACIFPTFFMAFTLNNAARRSDREADHRYKNNPGYAEWSANAPVLIPGPTKQAASIATDSRSEI